MMCNVFLRISVFFLLHLPPTSLTNAAWLMATKELFPLSYNVLVEKTKNTKKLFFKKIIFGVAGQISIFYTTLLRVLFRTPWPFCRIFMEKSPWGNQFCTRWEDTTYWHTCALCLGKIFSTFVSEGILLQNRKIYIVIMMMMKRLVQWPMKHIFFVYYTILTQIMRLSMYGQKWAGPRERSIVVQCSM